MKQISISIKKELEMYDYLKEHKKLNNLNKRKNILFEESTSLEY